MKTWLRLTLITMTVGGGFTGVAVALQMLLSHQIGQTASLLVFIGFLALFAFVVVSGLIYVQNPDRARPLAVALALQIPWVSSPYLTYKFAAGFQVSVAVISGRFIGGFRLGSDFQFYLLQPLPWGVGINFFALAMLILLLRSSAPKIAPESTAAAQNME